MSGKLKTLLIVIFLVPLFIVDVVRYFSLPSVDETEHRAEIRIRRGQALSVIADSLQSKGLIEDKKLFLFWAVSLGYEKSIKAGIFHVPYGLNYAQVAHFLADTPAQNISVTLIEGWTNEQIAAELAEVFDLKRSKLDSLFTARAFLKKLGIPAANIRGYLLPDTYSLTYGIKEEQIVSFLVKKTLKIFEPDSIRQLLTERNMDVHRVLTLASIIEGEAILDEERPLIASVYCNRLKRGMKLQADPTVQFLLPGKPRRLLYKDLKIDSPYNTYLHKGLPPGPINNPGKASIMAALYPERTPYLYFVAKGDGTHVFSRNASEHARAKAAFNRVRRQVKREKIYN